MDINVLTWNGKPEEKAKLETLLDKHKKLRREGVEEVPQKGGGSAAEEVSTVGQHNTGFIPEYEWVVNNNPVFFTVSTFDSTVRRFQHYHTLIPFLSIDIVFKKAHCLPNI